MVAEQQQQQQRKSEQRRHSLGLVMTSRPSSEWEPPGRELPTILESPGVNNPYVALHISESPSRPLTDLESALQKLEDGGKPLQDFDSALDGYRSSQLSRECGSFGFLTLIE